MLTAVVGCTWIEAHLGEKLANLSFSRKSICVQQEGTTHGYLDTLNIIEDQLYRQPVVSVHCAHFFWWRW